MLGLILKLAMGRGCPLQPEPSLKFTAGLSALRRHFSGQLHNVPYLWDMWWAEPRPV